MNKRTILVFTTVLLVIGSLLKIYYIDYTETWVRQHDVISFGADEGHACYIEYIYNNGSLPDFDPREKWGFFQPPLHHIISAAVMSVSYFFGAGDKTAQENIQIMTCAYMIILSLMSVLIYLRIYREGDVGLHNTESGKAANSLHNSRAPIQTGIIVTALIVAFHPVFVLFSGSINNDALALILSVLSIYAASVWYEKPSYFNTVLLAVLIGLAMCAKLTGGLVAVPIGILIVIKCFDLRGKNASKISFFIKNYFAKMCVFACIVFPLGLFFFLRNKIKWDVPINYIPPVGEVFPESTTFISRIFDIRTKSVYPYLISSGNEYDEFNVPLLMLKSSLFGEYNYSEYGRLINFSSKLLFATAIILLILCLYATVKMTFINKKIISLKWKILLFGTYTVYVLAYLYFALSSNNFSAGDIRYAAVAIMVEGIYLGVYTDTVQNKKLKTGIIALSVLFAGSSLVTYTMLGLRS